MTPKEMREWCRNHFNMMADGGVWGIPRCGIVFQKRGEILALQSVMPHDRQMLVTKKELLQQQVDEFDATVQNFGAAGIEVTDPDNLLPMFDEMPSSDWLGK